MGLNHAVQSELLKNNVRYRQLLDQHDSLKREIKHEGGLPAVDTTKLRMLKKKKLRIVDQMTVLERSN